MKQPVYQCQVCGTLADAQVATMMAQHRYEYWEIHRIDLPAIQGREAGIVQVLTCPACATLTQDLILESYRQRVRDGYIEGIH